MLSEGWPDLPDDRRACLLAIDLDDFKPINDHHGHAAGDLLLRQVGQRLRRSLPPPARIARVGGDEFMVMVTLNEAPAVGAALAAAQLWPWKWKVSLNSSAHDSLSESMIDELLALTRASGIAPQRVEFEVTKTAMVSDLNRALANLSRITANGDCVALDDFGTGYSNFEHLSRLPFSRVNIDRCFVRDWAESGHASKLIKTMIDVSRVLDIDCVVEGIEEERQFSLARASGAGTAQGFFIGAPMSSDELVPRFATNSRPLAVRN